MTLFAFTITFTMIWWVVLFMVLPFGVHTGEHEKGHDAGAPKRTYLLRKCVITTVVSLFLTWLLLYLAYSGVIDVDSIIGRG